MVTYTIRNTETEWPSLGSLPDGSWFVRKSSDCDSDGMLWVKGKELPIRATIKGEPLERFFECFCVDEHRLAGVEGSERVNPLLDVEIVATRKYPMN